MIIVDSLSKVLTGKNIQFRVKKIPLLLLVWITGSGVSGQDTLVLNYADAIRISLRQSYTIKTHELGKREMQHYYQYNRAMFKPRLDLNLNVPAWNEFVNRIEQPDGLPVYNTYSSLEIGGNMSFKYILPTGGNVAFSTNLFRNDLSTLVASTGEKIYTDQFYSRFWLSFNQPVFTRNRLRENLNEAEYRYRQAEHYFTRAQMDIVYEVTRGFYSLYRAFMEEEIAGEKLENSIESHRVAVLKSESGRIPKADVLSAEVSVSRDSASFLQSRNALLNEQEKFVHLIGLDLNQPVKILTTLEFPVFIIDDELAIEEALKNRLEIREGELDISLGNIELDRAKRERELSGNISAYYDLTGISTLGEGNTLDLAGSSFEDIGNRPDNRGIAFTLSFPILDWGRGREKVNQARVFLEEKELYLEDLKKTIRRQVEEVIRNVRESRAQIEIHEKTLELARRSYDISRMRFENGDISSQELSVEREALAGIQLEYLEAFIAYQLAANDLKRKTMWDFENNRSYLVSSE
jgi:outer membrane protein TolC